MGENTPLATKERLRDVMREVDTYNLPEGAYWALVHELMGMEYGDVFPIIGDDTDFFEYEAEPDVPQECKHCGRKFIDRYALSQHKRAKHRHFNRERVGSRLEASHG